MSTVPRCRFGASTAVPTRNGTADRPPRKWPFFLGRCGGLPVLVRVP
jgi:hypothetical protein